MEKEKTVEQRRIHWGILSEQRGKLLGLAAILVILYHFTADLAYSELPYWVTHTARWCYACAVPLGVAMFLFLSGMGLYFSLRKGTTLRVFYRNRYLSLLITYGLWGLVFWTVADFMIRGSGIRRFLFDYLLLSFWRYGDHSFWYVASVMAFFLIFPLLYWMLRPENKLRHVFFVLLLVLNAWYAFWLKGAHPYYYSYIEIYITRFPAFLIGIWCGAKVYDCKTFSVPDVLCLSGMLLVRLVTVIAYSTRYNTAWVYIRVPADCGSIVFLVLVAILFHCFPLRRISRVLLSASEYTLELYLTHLSMWNILGYYGLHGLQYFLPMVFIAVLLSIGLHKVSAILQNGYLRYIVPVLDARLGK